MTSQANTFRLSYGPPEYPHPASRHRGLLTPTGINRGPVRVQYRDKARFIRSPAACRLKYTSELRQESF